MQKGKLIVIEGTEASGKETQARLIVENLKNAGFNVFHFSFPQYNTPTGKIISGPFLGKIPGSESWFWEGSANIDPLVSSAYYAADRRYNMDFINEHLNKGEIVIVDRYVESNMAHQGGKLDSREERLKMYQKLDELEFNIMELPRPDAVLFMYMPYDYACILKRARKESSEKYATEEYLKKAERAYLELTEIYNFIKIDCVKDDTIRTINDINNEAIDKIKMVIEERLENEN